MQRSASILTLVVVVTCATYANASVFTSFVIREGAGGPPVISTPNPGETEFAIIEGGQKAGLGTNGINGYKLGEITQLAITRLDDRTRFTAGTGPYVAPYLNFWITDGTNFAVVANEPSDVNFQPLYNNGYDLDWNDLSDKAAKIYENNDKTWLPNNGVGLTFADLANFTILAPSVTQLTTGWPGLGSGAPREILTNIAYGVNWVFGDTLTNYVAGADGYIVSNPIAEAVSAAVPEPIAFLTWACLIGCAAVAGRRQSR